MRRRLAESRAEAVELIEAGIVSVGGLPAPKAATLVDASARIEVASTGPRYVSRGGLKLAGAMAAFGVEIGGRRALDAGASTGGFTHYLVDHGAGEVVAVDVGYGQLADRLRRHPAVKVVDRTNIRYVTAEDLGGRFDLVVADLSFISLCTVAVALADLTEDGADLVLLVKPQFEVGRQGVGKGGIVRDPELRRSAVENVVACLAAAGIGVCQVVASPIPGAKGNRELFVWARRGEPPRPDLEIPA